MIRKKIKDHLKENDKLIEEQMAYTENRRAADNLFILNYCIQMSYGPKKQLIELSGDFQKGRQH